MDRSQRLNEHLRRWMQAGLINDDQAGAIRLWEESPANAINPSSQDQFALPSRLSIVFGSLLLSIVIAMHAAGAWFDNRFRVMAVGLHTVGTVAFGAGLFLCAQIFHLDVAWSFRWGLLLWSIGAGVGWMVLRQLPQLVFLSLLLPGWSTALLISAVGQFSTVDATGHWVTPVATRSLLTSLTYFTAPNRPTSTLAVSVLLWVGGITLIPAALFWAVVATALDLPAFSEPLWLALLVWVLCGWFDRPGLVAATPSFLAIGYRSGLDDSRSVDSGQ